MVLKAYKQDDKYFLEHRKEGFDKSKFTIVGSPTITDEGIASGFSTENNIKLPDKFFPANLNSLNISISFSSKNLSSLNQAIFGCKQNSNAKALVDLRIRDTGGELVYSTGIDTQKVVPFTKSWDEQGRHIAELNTRNNMLELLIDNKLIKTVSDFDYVQPVDFYIGCNSAKADIIYLPTILIEVDNKDKYYALQT